MVARHGFRTDKYDKLWLLTFSHYDDETTGLPRNLEFLSSKQPSWFKLQKRPPFLAAQCLLCTLKDKEETSRSSAAWNKRNTMKKKL